VCCYFKKVCMPLLCTFCCWPCTQQTPASKSLDEGLPPIKMHHCHIGESASVEDTQKWLPISCQTHCNVSTCEALMHLGWCCISFKGTQLRSDAVHACIQLGNALLQLALCPFRVLLVQEARKTEPLILPYHHLADLQGPENAGMRRADNESERNQHEHRSTRPHTRLCMLWDYDTGSVIANC